MTTYESLIAEARDGHPALVEVERGDAHALVRMSDPERLNALSAPMTLQLLDALGELAADDAVRAIVLTGADPAFSAGGDLRLMKEDAHPMVDESPGGATEAWRWIRRQFGGVTRTIVKARRLGYQRAFELFAEGRTLDGTEAAELGLANEVVPHDDLLPAAMRHVERMAALPPHVVPLTKALLRQAADMTWDQAIATEEFAEPMCFTTAGHRNAVTELLSG
jgi:2-(1,2-epoxy-1,2-dihydrophenyl)acetyl-CoA isomerase